MRASTRVCDAAPTNGEEQQVKRGEKVGQHVHHRGQLHHGVIGGFVEEEDNDKDLDDNCGYQLRIEWCAGFVGASQLLGEQAVQGHQGDGFSAEHLPRYVCAEHRKAQTNRDKGTAPRSHYCF